MERNNVCHENRSEIEIWLSGMDGYDQEKLLDKYSKKTAEVCNQLNPQEYLDVKMDILVLKYSREALLDSYVNNDSVVDYPGLRLNEFLAYEKNNPITEG